MLGLVFIILVICILLNSFKNSRKPKVNWQKRYSQSLAKVFRDKVETYDIAFRNKSEELAKNGKLNFSYEVGRESDKWLDDFPVKGSAMQSVELWEEYISKKIRESLSRLKVTSITAGEIPINIADVKFKLGIKNEDGSILYLGQKDFNRNRLGEGTCITDALADAISDVVKETVGNHQK